MIGDIVRSDALTPTLSHGEREEIVPTLSYGEREENRSDSLVQGEAGNPFRLS